MPLIGPEGNLIASRITSRITTAESVVFFDRLAFVDGAVSVCR